MGLVTTRERARALILAGEVLVNETPITKAGQLVSEDSLLRLRNKPQKYVSRGGDKLEGALKYFNLDVSNLICLDVGSSTGGFTDCLLKSHAQFVYCIDVGTNQLDHGLRFDSRVRVFEKTHVKDLKLIVFDPKPSFVVIDVSFIGLSKVLPHVVSSLTSGDQILMLIKPQFELGQELIGKGGVPKAGVDPYRAVLQVKSTLGVLGLEYLGDTPSQIKGKKSENQEYFLLARVN